MTISSEILFNLVQSIGWTLVRFASKHHTFLEVGLDPQNIPNTKPEEVFGRLGTKQPNMLKLESFTETTLKSFFLTDFDEGWRDGRG